MSADKDRAVRRQKQKRAKDQKKQAKQQYQAGGAQPEAGQKSSAQKSA